MFSRIQYLMLWSWSLAWKAETALWLSGLLGLLCCSLWLFVLNAMFSVFSGLVYLFELLRPLKTTLRLEMNVWWTQTAPLYLILRVISVPRISICNVASRFAEYKPPARYRRPPTPTGNPHNSCTISANSLRDLARFPLD